MKLKINKKAFFEEWLSTIKNPKVRNSFSNELRRNPEAYQTDLEFEFTDLPAFLKINHPQKGIIQESLADFMRENFAKLCHSLTKSTYGDYTYKYLYGKGLETRREQYIEYIMTRPFEFFSWMNDNYNRSRTCGVCKRGTLLCSVDVRKGARSATVLFPENFVRLDNEDGEKTKQELRKLMLFCLTRQLAHFFRHKLTKPGHGKGRKAVDGCPYADFIALFLEDSLREVYPNVDNLGAFIGDQLKTFKGKGTTKTEEVKSQESEVLSQLPVVDYS